MFQRLQQPPEPKAVQDNGRVDNAAVPLPDGTAPKLKIPKSKPRVRHRQG
jgi:hypothetical protein